MGGRGASSSGGGSFGRFLKGAKNGELGITKEDIQDIQNDKYGLATDRLSKAERKALSKMVSDSIDRQGKKAKNDKATIEDINKGNIAKVNISQFNEKELESFAKMAKKISSTASTFAMTDALKLLSWKNQ